MDRADEGGDHGNGARVCVSAGLRTSDASARAGGDAGEDRRRDRPIATGRLTGASTNGAYAGNCRVEGMVAQAKTSFLRFFFVLVREVVVFGDPPK